MFRDVGNPEFVRGESVEFAMNEVVGGRHPVRPFDLRRSGKSGDPGMTHQNGDEPLADPNAHSEGEFRVNAPGTIGLPGGRVNLPDQPGQPLLAHLSRREDAVLVFVVAGAADAEKPAADFGPVARLHQGVDYRVNPFGPGRSSPRSFAATFRISTSVSSCRKQCRPMPTYPLPSPGPARRRPGLAPSTHSSSRGWRKMPTSRRGCSCPLSRKDRFETPLFLAATVLLN